MDTASTSSQVPTLETERLILRQLKPDDAADMFEYASDPEVAQYVTWEAHESIENSRAFIKMVLESPPGEGLTWGIVHKGDGKFIGTIGFFPQRNPKNARAEIGYALAKPYWGQGYMTEAVRTVISYGFGTMDLNRIEAMCLLPNVASARVMEKCGMHYEGILRQYMMIKGAYQDLKMYSILKEEWAS